MKQKVLITAALPYANGPLHFGHIAGAYLPADCYARYMRLRGHDVLYICGSDEYGVAITITAELEKRTPKEQVDHYHAINKAFFETLGMSFDHFSRTTWEGHIPTAQAFFLDLWKNGYIEEKITTQLYSEKEGRFLADRYVSGSCPHCHFENARGDECPKCGASYEATDLLNPKSKISGSALILKPTKHWFLLFDRFKDKLSAWLLNKKWKPNVTRFAMRYVEDLKPRAITRDGHWGVPIPLPDTEGKVLYVWFDAPIGYISATKEWAELQGKPDLWEKYWKDPETTLVQFIGKDNIPFHAVFFPAMIMGQNEPYKLPDEVPANEFYNLEGRQFSKSEGWTIDLKEFFSHYTADQIRYAIAANAPETQDAEFTWKDFQARCNADLLGKYGNLANRVLVFTFQNTQGIVPKKHKTDEVDEIFLAKVDQVVQEIEHAYEHYSLRKACQHIMELCSLANVYFDAKKPWQLAKDSSNREALETVLFICLDTLKKLAVVSSPVIPTASQKLWEMLGYEAVLAFENWAGILQEAIPEGRALKKPQILFARVEDELIEKEIQLLAKLKEKFMEKPLLQKTFKDPIEFADFQKLDLRIGKIETAERIAKSKKLLKLSVDLGLEKRTIVAGIGEHFATIETLIGKQVIVVANLKPAILMGVESQGMILAAHGLNGLELPSITQSESGSPVN